MGLHRSKVVWFEMPYWISGSLAVRRGFHNPKVGRSADQVLLPPFFFLFNIKFLTKQITETQNTIHGHSFFIFIFFL